VERTVLARYSAIRLAVFLGLLALVISRMGVFTPEGAARLHHLDKSGMAAWFGVVLVVFFAAYGLSASWRLLLHRGEGVWSEDGRIFWADPFCFGVVRSLEIDRVASVDISSPNRTLTGFVSIAIDDGGSKTIDALVMTGGGEALATALRWLKPGLTVQNYAKPFRF